MNTEEELLADGLIEIISWVKSNPDDSVTKPLLVGEIVAYGRAYLSFIYMVVIAFCVISVFCALKGFKEGLSLDWGQLKKLTPQLTLGIVGCVSSFALLVMRADSLMQVWFAPRMYVIDKITQIVVYQ
jgi:hypothetical protein